ncbi:hypothetical protein O181_101476 [Austropuccinia psidii MF-1]|uniref:Uncharacterized protein n=1 Tax=Austropuccinia psidii MF-1 TaxID=1389203 RepID=A0A9Q3JGS7_9BASI|nr:hypothetical protein [Austropuccinia psidii MF-1]
MTPSPLRNVGFPRNQPEHWPRKQKGRKQPMTGPNDKSTTRGFGRFRTSHTNLKTPERPLYKENGQQKFEYGSIIGRSGNNIPEDLSQENELDGSHELNEGLEYQQRSKALRRKSNHNQREPCINTSHKKGLQMKAPSQIQVPQDMGEEPPSSQQQARSSRP